MVEHCSTKIKMDIQLNFAGKHAVVFGGTNGINLGIALALARRGAAVTVVSRKPDNVASATAMLRGCSASVFGACADVRDFEAVGKSLAEAHCRFGPIDVLVSGAAGNFLQAANKMSSNGFRTVVDIDLVGTFNVMRQAYDHLRKPGASVINITAPQSVVPMRYQVHASAAKAGVDQLTRALALEWGVEGVRINAISPGPIAGTEGFRRLLAADAQQEASAREHVPIKRFGTLDDVANLALFLASEFAGFISGAVIPCDGGGALESVKPALEAAGQRMLAGQHQPVPVLERPEGT
jgi:NAD(P)-dependent dehydrogenase (short-subunit alcohol dehydrogenase family)